MTGTCRIHTYYGLEGTSARLVDRHAQPADGPGVFQEGRLCDGPGPDDAERRAARGRRGGGEARRRAAAVVHAAAASGRRVVVRLCRDHVLARHSGADHLVSTSASRSAPSARNLGWGRFPAAHGPGGRWSGGSGGGLAAAASAAALAAGRFVRRRRSSGGGGGGASGNSPQRSPTIQFRRRLRRVRRNITSTQREDAIAMKTISHPDRRQSSCLLLLALVIGAILLGGYNQVIGLDEAVNKQWAQVQEPVAAALRPDSQPGRDRQGHGRAGTEGVSRHCRSPQGLLPVSEQPARSQQAAAAGADRSACCRDCWCCARPIRS